MATGQASRNLRRDLDASHAQQCGITAVSGRYRADYRRREDNNPGRGTILWYICALSLDR